MTSMKPTRTSTSTGPDALRAEVERTRHELGDTVEALAAKADVRSRALARADRMKGQLRDRADQARIRARRARHPGHGGTGRAPQPEGGPETGAGRSGPAPLARTALRDKRLLAAVAVALAALGAMAGRRQFCHRSGHRA
jgi:hypothetical protein